MMLSWRRGEIIQYDVKQCDVLHIVMWTHIEDCETWHKELQLSNWIQVLVVDVLLDQKSNDDLIPRNLFTLWSCLALFSAIPPSSWWLIRRYGSVMEHIWHTHGPLKIGLVCFTHFVEYASDLQLAVNKWFTLYFWGSSIGTHYIVNSNTLFCIIKYGLTSFMHLWVVFCSPRTKQH